MLGTLVVTIFLLDGVEVKNCAPPHISVERMSSDFNCECTHNRVNVFKRYDSAWLFQGQPRSDDAMLTAASTVSWSSATKLSDPYDTALVRASFPHPLLSFLFYCSYSSLPKSFLLFSYLHAPLPPILLFFSLLRHLSTKLHGVKSQILIFLNTHHHENLEGKRYCSCAYLSIVPWGHMGEWRINSIHFGIQH